MPYQQKSRTTDKFTLYPDTSFNVDPYEHRIVGSNKKNILAKIFSCFI